MIRRLAGITAALLLLSGCVLISGAGSFDVVDDQQQANDGNDAGGPGQVKDDGSPDPTIAADPIDAGTDASLPTGLKRPPTGVYTYTTTGGDELSLFSFKTTYGNPPATVTIEYDGENCFKQTIKLRDKYTELMNECIVGQDTVHSSGVRAQEFPLVGTATTNQTCAPGDVYFSTNRRPNQTWDHTCVGTSSDSKSGGSSFTTAGSFRFVSDEMLTVMDASIKVAHYRDERAVTGSQTGANTADWYFDTTTGVIVKLVRNIQIQYKSIVGTITYTEAVTMTLNGWTQ